MVIIIHKCPCGKHLITIKMADCRGSCTLKQFQVALVQHLCQSPSQPSKRLLLKARFMTLSHCTFLATLDTLLMTIEATITSECQYVGFSS